jgi:hypothetical protein
MNILSADPFDTRNPLIRIIVIKLNFLHSSGIGYNFVFHQYIITNIIKNAKHVAMAAPTAP